MFHRFGFVYETGCSKFTPPTPLDEKKVDFLKKSDLHQFKTLYYKALYFQEMIKKIARMVN